MLRLENTPTAMQPARINLPNLSIVVLSVRNQIPDVRIILPALEGIRAVNRVTMYFSLQGADQHWVVPFPRRSHTFLGKGMQMANAATQRFHCPSWFVWRNSPDRGPHRRAAGEQTFFPVPLGTLLRPAAWPATPDEGGNFYPGGEPIEQSVRVQAGGWQVIKPKAD
jgi:hypothetical protein